MADDVKKVVIEIKAETTKATKEIKSLNAQIEKLERQNKKMGASLAKTTKATSKMGASFKTLGEHLSRLIVIYGSFSAISNTITTIADFEQAMVNLGAISNATGEELKALEEKAKELGESTVFTASQVASGMTEMARAGLSAQQQLDGIGAVLNLSVTGLVDLSEATIIATNTMNSFGLEAKDLGTVTDVLTKGINNSAQNLEQLGQALAKVGSVAYDQNMSLEETVAVLGVLADAGRKGAEAGTQLKISLLRIGANAEATKYINELNDMFSDLNVSMYDATGKLKPFTERLDVLNKAFKRLSVEQASMYKSRIFGTEAIASVNIMLRELDKIKLKTKLMQNSFGYADQQAIMMMNTLKGSYKELLSALEGLQIKIGKQLTPILMEALDGATEFIRSISAEEIDRFGNSVSKLVGFLSEIIGIFSDLSGMAIDFGLSLEDAFKGVSAEFLVLMGVIYKLRKALLLLATSNPILATLAVTVGYAATKMFEAERALKKFEDRTDSFIEKNKNFTGIIDEAVVAIKELDEQKLRNVSSNLTKEITSMENSISSYTREIEKMEKKQKEAWFVTEQEKITLQSLKEQRAVLTSHLKEAIKWKEKIAQAGQKSIDIRRKELGINEEYRISDKVLTQEQIKSIDIIINRYEKRKQTLENTLTTMLNKEKRYTEQLRQLEEDLQKTRQEFTNKRETLIANFENEISTIRASSYSDLQQYNDAQRRADEYLYKAKQALAQNNLTMAKNYMSIYNSLITKNTNSEIKEGERVVKTKKQLNDELIRDKQVGHNIELAILEKERKIAIANIENKIRLKKAEIKMAQIQIELQIKAIALQAKMIEKMTGVKDIGFEKALIKAQEETKKLSSEVDSLLSQSKEMKIEALLDTSGVDATLSNLKPKATVEVNADSNSINAIQEDIDKRSFTIEIKDLKTGEIEKKTIELSNGIKNVVEEPLEITIDGVDDKKADKDINDIKDKAKEPTVFELNANTSKAEETISSMQQKAREKTTSEHEVNPNTAQAQRAIDKLKKNTSSTHTVYVKTVQKRATGGFIPREGKLGGYGGGDRIKALLEAGEFIVRKEAVKKLGLSRLEMINRGEIPRFATGGLVLNSQDRSVLEEIANNTLATNNGTSLNGGSSWADLISSLKSILEKELPPSFRVAFEKLLKEAQAKEAEYNTKTTTAQNGIDALKNSVVGKNLTEDEYAQYQQKLTEKQNKLTELNSAIPKEIDSFNGKISELQRNLDKYLKEVDYYKNKIMEKYNELGVSPSFELENSMDLDRLKNYANKLLSMKLVTNSYANKLARDVFYGREKDLIWETYKDPLKRGFFGMSDKVKSIISQFMNSNGWSNIDIANTLNKSLIPKFKTGGFIPREGKLGGYGGGDKIPALLEAGEFIVRKEAVKGLGVDFLKNINNLQIPKFQTGGYVGSVPSNTSISRNVNVNFIDKDGGSITVQTDEQIAYQLERYFKRFA